MAKRKAKKRDFKDWYEENAEILNAERAVKYATDSSYRKKAKARSQEQYRKENFILDDGSRVVFSEGEGFVAWKVSQAARILRTNLSTLRGYFSMGYLPVLNFDGTNLTLVTVDQIPLIRKFLKRTKKKSPRVVADEMWDEMQTHWRDRDGSQKIIDQEK